MSPGTIGEYLYRAYANLAMAHAAVAAGMPAYVAAHYAIRSRVFRELTEGPMRPRSIVDEERLKLSPSRACCYCGTEEVPLTLDHLVPTAQGGPDTADNIVWACRPCNSSKGPRDLVRWSLDRGGFPPLLLLRRYLKLAIRHCEEAGLMDCLLTEAPPMPFDLTAIPTQFPAPANLVL